MYDIQFKTPITGERVHTVQMKDEIAVNSEDYRGWSDVFQIKTDVVTDCVINVGVTSEFSLYVELHFPNSSGEVTNYDNYVDCEIVYCSSKNVYISRSIGASSYCYYVKTYAEG